MIYMLSRVHSVPQAAVLFSQVQNMAIITNLPSTNDTKNMFLKILLAANTLYSKNNETV